MGVEPRRYMPTLLFRTSWATRITEATYRHVAPRLIAGKILTIADGIYIARITSGMRRRNSLARMARADGPTWSGKPKKGDYADAYTPYDIWKC